MRVRSHVCRGRDASASFTQRPRPRPRCAGATPARPHPHPRCPALRAAGGVRGEPAPARAQAGSPDGQPADCPVAGSARPAADHQNPGRGHLTTGAPLAPRPPYDRNSSARRPVHDSSLLVSSPLARACSLALSRSRAAQLLPWSRRRPPPRRRTSFVARWSRPAEWSFFLEVSCVHRRVVAREAVF